MEVQLHSVLPLYWREENGHFTSRPFYSRERTPVPTEQGGGSEDFGGERHCSPGQELNPRPSSTVTTPSYPDPLTWI